MGRENGTYSMYDVYTLRACLFVKAVPRKPDAYYATSPFQFYLRTPKNVVDRFLDYLRKKPNS